MVEVIFSPSFNRALKRLSKPYRFASLDVERVVDQLETGETPGNLVPGVGYDVYKVRVENRSANRGKQGGFRVLYYLQTSDRLYLMTIYSKTEREDISVEEIRALVEEVLADDVPTEIDVQPDPSNDGEAYDRYRRLPCALSTSFARSPVSLRFPQFLKSVNLSTF